MIWTPMMQTEETRSLAGVRLAPRKGLEAVAQILGLVALIHGHGMSAPIRLEDYLVDIQTVTVVLVGEALTTNTEQMVLDVMGRQRQLIEIAAEGLRLIRSPKLLGPEYAITGPEEMASLEFLLMMRQGIFPTAQAAHERAIEISNL